MRRARRVSWLVGGLIACGLLAGGLCSGRLAPVQRAAGAAADEMIEVPAGELVAGSEIGDPDERPQRVARVAAYAIDRHEVTQAQYARCVAAGACRTPVRYAEAEGPTLPAVGIGWLDAVRYCRWAGKRLPSELEWERAARGTDGRRYPWGAGLDCARANFGSFAGDGPCAGANPGRVLPVGSRPRGASPIGAQDMAGNVWEWVAPVAATALRDDDERASRVVRGGSCCSYFAMPTTTNRLVFPAGYTDRDIGWRCAR